ncbi:MAG: hypothetical protein JO051_03030 [Acidobacteriaceae bacterium]|nr:hypothetical protein [Acidobacteriaceae bacterium]
MLSRRDLLSALAFAAIPAPAAPNGTSLLLRLSDRKLIVSNGLDVAATWRVPPGSTLKPLTLWGLLEAGKLNPSDEYLCPGTLVLAGRNMTCTHPRTALPMDISRAIAYSCNCTVAHFAERFEPGELPRFLRRLGLSSTSGFSNRPEAAGTFAPNLAGPPLQLQALGETSIEVSALEMLAAYAMLARRTRDATVSPLIDGLEGAVEYGTAQQAKLSGIRVAGKTGSVRDASGAHLACFAGFAPSRSPEVVTTVLVQGSSGGADAAPIAARLLRSYFSSRA